MHVPADLTEIPVTIKENEYGVIENAFAQGLMSPKPPKVRTGKSVAVIGSGPAGLAAAEELKQKRPQRNCI